MFQLALVVLAGFVLIEFSNSGGEKRFVLETDLETELVNMKLAFAGLQNNFNNLTNQIRDLETKVTKLTTENTRLLQGYTAGKHHTQVGSGTDIQCLPDDPTWSNYVDGVSNWRAYMYGFELQSPANDHIFNGAVYNEDIPCAVCQSKWSTAMMIPGRNNCYGNWTMEYNGYLMTAGFAQQGTSHVCVDDSPVFVPGGAGDDNEGLLFLVEGRCGTLQCPPYVEGRELACVVCSK